MDSTAIRAPRARLPVYLCAGYTVFILYASLAPFTGWQQQGLNFSAVLSAPLAQTYTPFDAVVNALAYVPFGLLFALALRTASSSAGRVLIATVAGSTLSAAMEYAQMYLPVRVSSNVDLLANSAGTLAGALLAVSIPARAWLAMHVAGERRRLFHAHDSRDMGMALLVLWSFGQINPSLPMLGNVFISEVNRMPFVLIQPEPFSWLESLMVLLNLLMLGALLLTLLRMHRHTVGVLLLVLCTVALIKFVTAAMLLKSWALMLWLNSEALLGIVCGVLLLLAAGWLRHAWLVRITAVIAVVYLLLAHWMLDIETPSAAMQLYQWHYGHLLTYNGLSQTITLVFPFLLLAYLWRIRKR
ncbi:MAG: VanZ family protein [Pseudomonadota bacterium]